MLRSLLLVAAVVFTAAYNDSSERQAVITVENSQGGLIYDFDMNRYLWEDFGVKVQIAGECASACVIYAGMDTACLLPRASDGTETRILFHQGWDKYPYMRAGGWATYMMMARMGPKLKRYVEEYGEPLPTFDSGEWLVLEYEEAVREGIMKAC